MNLTFSLPCVVARIDNYLLWQLYGALKVRHIILWDETDGWDSDTVFEDHNSLLVGHSTVQIVKLVLHADQEMHILWRLGLIDHWHNFRWELWPWTIKRSTFLFSRLDQSIQNVVLLPLDILRHRSHYDLCVDLRIRIVRFHQVVRWLLKVLFEKNLEACWGEFELFGLMHLFNVVKGALIVQMLLKGAMAV